MDQTGVTIYYSDIELKNLIALKHKEKEEGKKIRLL